MKAGTTSGDRFRSWPEILANAARAAGGLRALGVADLRRRRHDENLHIDRNAEGDLRQQISMDHEHLGPAVGQDVTGLLRREMPVDRHGIGAEMARRDFPGTKSQGQARALPRWWENRFSQQTVDESFERVTL